MKARQLIDAVLPETLAIMLGLAQPPERMVRARSRKKRDRRTKIAKTSRKRNR